MELGKGRKAMGLGIIVCFGLVTMLLMFQNCQKGGAVVDGVTTGAQNSNSTSTSSITPTSSAPVTTMILSSGGYAYPPIRSDLVCSDSNSDRQSIIVAYIRLLRRCPERPGLDFWYNFMVRAGSNLSVVEQGIRASVEYAGKNTPAQNTSTLFCLAGDDYEILANGQVQSVSQIDALSASDSRPFTNRCRTNISQNATTALSQIARDTVSPMADANGGFVCSVPGDSLRNHIIDLYIGYLDRCPEAAGLNWWVANWNGDSGFTGSSDVQSYLKCRYVGGNMSSPPQASIDTCYRQQLNIIMCNAGAAFVKTRYCEKTGS
jgi:hypothetical protein